MCTIVIAHRVHAEAPLLVAANRDEFYSRRGDAPQILRDVPRVIGGVDGERGGTWMGATPGGFFAGITNQRTWRVPDASLRSRGEVALNVLSIGSVAAAEGLLRELDADQYNDFNLVFGDGDEVRVAYARRGEGVSIEALEPGLYALANDRLGSKEFPKAQLVADLSRRVMDAPLEDALRELGRVMGSHELPDERTIPPPPTGSPISHDVVKRLQAVCVHTSSYGTVSSTLYAAEPGRVLRYAFADGPPCRTEYAPFEALFRS
jgi:uncharacterized protein with NRDE domain